MFLNIGKRLWLAGLALVPVVGVGQGVLVDPESVTVCLGEEALFTSSVVAGLSGWYINGIAISTFLSPEDRAFVRRFEEIDADGAHKLTKLQDSHKLICGCPEVS